MAQTTVVPVSVGESSPIHVRLRRVHNETVGRVIICLMSGRPRSWSARRRETLTSGELAGYPPSADDLYLVADVQGVVEGLRGGLCEVHAPVGADGDAAFVEGVAVVEEH
jgi:ribosomal protein S18 acetylase RimI-like enzyme